jgi:hypothetical protein
MFRIKEKDRKFLRQLKDDECFDIDIGPDGALNTSPRGHVCHSNVSSSIRREGSFGASENPSHGAFSPVERCIRMTDNGFFEVPIVGSSNSCTSDTELFLGWYTHMVQDTCCFVARQIIQKDQPKMIQCLGFY